MEAATPCPGPVDWETPGGDSSGGERAREAPATLTPTLAHTEEDEETPAPTEAAASQEEAAREAPATLTPTRAHTEPDPSSPPGRSPTVSPTKQEVKEEEEEEAEEEHERRVGKIREAARRRREERAGMSTEEVEEAKHLRKVGHKIWEWKVCMAGVQGTLAHWTDEEHAMVTTRIEERRKKQRNEMTQE